MNTLPRSGTSGPRTHRAAAARGDYGTALQAASDGRHDQIVQRLLEKGADVNAQGGRYCTALQAASVRGHDQIKTLG